MGIANLGATPPRKMPAKCQWRPWYDRLTEAQQVAIVQAFDNQAWTTSAIARELIEDGCPVSHTTIVTHRKFRCMSCNERDGRTK